MDDFDALHQAARDPAALWAREDRVVLDEVQRSPRLLSAVKQRVDRKRPKVSFILSGSANLLLMHQASESLAGRAVYFALSPMTQGEMHGRPAPEWIAKLLKGKMPEEGRVKTPAKEPVALIVRGFMPALLTLSRREAVIRSWEGYVATYLERDLRQISQIGALAEFRRLMETVALRSGQMLNQTEVARDIGLSQPTVHRYLNMLEGTHLLERLPAFARHRTKRLMKSPKVYCVDPGLAAYLAGHHDAGALRSAREAGGLFESVVLLHLRALTQLLTPRPRLSYWRTVSGKEVDLVIEQGRKLLAVEIKLTSNPRYGDAERLRLFLEEYPEALAGLLVYAGGEIKYLGEKIVALPWHLLSGEIS